MLALDLFRFDRMFPNYYDFLTPMRSDWRANPRELILSVVVPGYEKEDFKLFVEDDSLNLEINSKKNHLSYSIVDSLYSSDYDLEKAEAEYKNGILKVTIPKLPKKESKAIPIKVS